QHSSLTKPNATMTSTTNLNQVLQIAGGSTSKPPQRILDQSDFMKFRGDDLLVNRLHDVLVGAGVQRTRDMGDIVLGGAEHHLGHIAARHPAQIAQEFIAVHHRHVPVEQHGIGQSVLAGFQCLLAVFGLDDLEIQPFQDPPCDFSDDARVIDNQTCLHFQPLLLSGPERVVSITDRVACAFCRPYAATLSGAISRMRSTSSTTISCPSSRCTPAAIFVSRGSRLTGLTSRLSSASLRTWPIESISSPYDSPRRSTPTAIGGL